MRPESELSHSDCTCLYLVALFITQLCCRHLVRRPLQAAPSQYTLYEHEGEKKYQAQRSPGHFPFSLPKLFFSYCVPRIGKGLYRTTLFLSANSYCTARSSFCLIIWVVSRILFIFRSQSEFLAKFTDNAFCGRKHCSLCNIS